MECEIIRNTKSKSSKANIRRYYFAHLTEERLDMLKVEYKRWIAKYLELEPKATGIPGEPHGYVSKRARLQLVGLKSSHLMYIDAESEELEGRG